jgi:hypothetical protein
MKLALIITAFIFTCVLSFAQTRPRYESILDSEWKSVASSDSSDNPAFQSPQFDDSSWSTVSIPHNWDSYEGYRRLKHGNRHGYAWYRKTLQITPDPERRYFLWFHGVGSYATVWVNARRVGYHAGGRTSFTIDITDVLIPSGKNIIAVRADHPPSIQDLPWVCGGCSEEIGFSEGSQPMGIFRPVYLVTTGEVRIEPFGVHIWNDTTISETSATLNFSTEVRNYSNKSRTVTLLTTMFDKQGKRVVKLKTDRTIAPQQTVVISQVSPRMSNVNLWSIESPYLYNVVSVISEKSKSCDEVVTPYGIRWIKWPTPGISSSNQFFLNGKPVFINGTAEYEHLMGQSHAFTHQQVRARMMQIKAAGFNAFRDAHQPHNLLYHSHGDQLGMLWWTQMAAHIWFDTPEFRKNFKSLLIEWVKERRNSPSVVLWGLENESHLPYEFARECTELIRSLDPTTSQQRKVTTCNGGEGTDWDVPQNWTGTYGGDPQTYAEDLERQVLIGEYGAWRSLDLHTEGPFKARGPVSEDRMTQLMETKIRLAESAKDKCSGHFHWLFTSHENPGRVQGGEGYRELDRVGPVNYKGLFTSWGEPLDVFYMYRSNYANPKKEPMVYIASHTWPDRWIAPGVKDSIIVYSNCDSVELFNDVNSFSLGMRKRGGPGTHFQWDHVTIQYNVLYAVGYANGNATATDQIILNHLPKASRLERITGADKNLLAATDGLNYPYRVNCGGPSYRDSHGSVWLADRHHVSQDGWGSTSWTDEFTDMPAFFGSQRKTNDPIKGTKEWSLFQTYRWGRDKLKYHFPLPNGEYTIELYFTEPWYGIGGGMNCKEWRVFDVAANDTTIIKDLDIWAEVGHATALKKTAEVMVTNGVLTISFPRVTSGQAVISAIAIGTRMNVRVAHASTSLFQELKGEGISVGTWLNTGDKAYKDQDIYFSELPSRLHGAEWLRTSASQRHNKKLSIEFDAMDQTEIYVAMDTRVTQLPEWLRSYENIQRRVSTACSGQLTHYTLYRKIVPAHSHVELGPNGISEQETLAMYLVMALPVSNLQPAVDLRPISNYKISEASLNGTGVIADSLFNRPCVRFRSSSFKNSLEWSITPGVADLYAIRVRYYHRSENSQEANLKIIAADGTLMSDERVQFIPVSEDKWKVMTTSTGTMINAGTYKVILTPANNEPLYIRDLEVQ